MLEPTPKRGIIAQNLFAQIGLTMTTTMMLLLLLSSSLLLLLLLLFRRRQQNVSSKEPLNSFVRSLERVQRQKMRRGCVEDVEDVEANLCCPLRNDQIMSIAWPCWQASMGSPLDSSAPSILQPEVRISVVILCTTLFGIEMTN